MNFCPACGARLKVKEISPAVSRMIEDYRKRLSTKPEDADAHYNLALAYLEAEEAQLAEAELRRVIELEPEFADARVRLAIIYLRRGEKEAARSELEKALQAEPENAAVKRLLESI
jgi:Tfp pilus assembly protein PilF